MILSVFSVTENCDAKMISATVCESRRNIFQNGLSVTFSNIMRYLLKPSHGTMKPAAGCADWS